MPINIVQEFRGHEWPPMLVGWGWRCTLVLLQARIVVAEFSRGQSTRLFARTFDDELYREVQAPGGRTFASRPCVCADGLRLAALVEGEENTSTKDVLVLDQQGATVFPLSAVLDGHGGSVNATELLSFPEPDRLVVRCALMPPISSYGDKELFGQKIRVPYWMVSCKVSSGALTRMIELSGPFW